MEKLVYFLVLMYKICNYYLISSTNENQMMISLVIIGRTVLVMAEIK
jgi:hypothetical protein